MEGDELTGYMIRYVQNDPDVIPDAGTVNLNRVFSDLETLGMEVAQFSDDTTVGITITTANGVTTLSAKAREWFVPIHRLRLMNDKDTGLDLADIGCENYRQIAAVVALFAATGEMEVATLREMDLFVGSGRWRVNWSWDGWVSEVAETTNGRPDVDYLTVRDEEGEEVAIIVDRNSAPEGMDERRRRKEALAQKICDAMNGDL